MTPQNLIKKLEEYSAETGLKTSTICRRVFGNHRYLDRLRSRVDRLSEESKRLDEYISSCRANKDSATDD